MIGRIKRKKRNSIAVSWFWSYIIVLMVPIIISAIIYITSTDVINKEIIRTNQSLLEEIQQVADAKLRELERITTEISFNKRIVDLISVDYSLTTDKTMAYNISLFAKELRLFMLGNDFIEDIYIFHKKSDELIGTSACLSEKSFYDTYVTSGGSSYEAWKDFLNDTEQRMFMSIPVKNEGGSNKRSLLVRIPLISQYTNTDIIFIVDESKLFNDIQDRTLLLSSHINVVDSNNNINISTDYNKDYSFVDYKAVSENAFIRKKHNNDKFVIMYIPSKIFKQQYIMITNVNIYWEKTQNIKLIMLLSLILCLAIGGIVCFLLMKKNYSPINMLVSTLVDKKGMNSCVKHDELQFLQNAIMNTLEENETVIVRKKQQERNLLHNFWVAVLKGKVVTDQKATEYFNTYNLILQSDQFSVMVFYIEDYSEFTPKDIKVDGIKEYRLVQFLITNIVEELANQNCAGYMCEIDRMLVCIINFKGNDSENNKQELSRISRDAQDSIKKYFKICLSISISNIHETVSGIAVAYEEALEAMEYKMVMGIGKILQYSLVTKNNTCAANQYYYPEQIENQLINCVKAADIESAKRIVYQIFEKNYSERSISIQMTKCLLFSMISTMVKAVNEICDLYGNNFADEIDPVQRLIDCETIDKMKLEMINILEVSCTYIEQRKKEDKLSTNMKIVEYIQTNFKDPDLSIAKVAECFNISPSYVSRLFKEQTDKGILDYISEKRIEEAKLLLKKNKYTVKEVATQVGYYDIKTFIRNFKKFEGITPGKFKELN